MNNAVCRIILSIGISLALFTLVNAQPASGKTLSLEVTDSYVRMVPPGQKNTGVFMTLTNASNTERKLINAKSTAAKIVELHTHVHDGSMMRMRQIEKITIPAEGTTELKPGGLHVMLIDLQQKIVKDEPVEILLEFDNGEIMRVNAIGRKLKMKMQNNQAH